MEKNSDGRVREEVFIFYFFVVEEKNQDSNSFWEFFFFFLWDFSVILLALIHGYL